MNDSRDRSAPWLAPLTPLFAAGVRLRNRGYERGWWPAARLAAPVVSVGNIAVGGRAKTPAIIAIGRELQRRGVVFDVLTRGYRRHSRELAMACRGDEDPRQTGDEALLIARQLQAPVLVHADRARAGAEGERRCGSRLHLLDDGMQHRQLARNFDLALVTAGDFRDRLLPAGRLRESPAALARAQAVLWLSDAPLAGPLPSEEAERARAIVGRWTDAAVFLAAKRPRGSSSPRRPVAFCALAEPASFWATLVGLGVEPVARFAYRDHHRYRPGDLERLTAAARDGDADGFATTEKDAVNLDAAARARLQPLSVIGIELQIDGLERLVDLVEEKCGVYRS